MRAIILDAGEGRRLRPLTSFRPKCLLRLNDVTILEHQLANIAKFGLREVIIVVGYCADQVIRKVKELNFDLNFEFVLNQVYYKTNTVYSLWLAKEYIRKHDFVYFNGDVVFHEEVLGRLLRSPHDTCVAIERKNVGEEEVKVLLDSDIVRAIGKNVEISKAHGEFIGIAKFSRRFNDLFVDKLNKVVSEGMINEFFEVALNRTLKSYDVYAVDVSDLPCIEVDTFEDLNVAKKIYFKITEGKWKV